jgi:hypothetical protein
MLGLLIEEFENRAGTARPKEMPLEDETFLASFENPKPASTNPAAAWRSLHRWTRSRVRPTCSANEGHIMTKPAKRMPRSLTIGLLVIAVSLVIIAVGVGIGIAP